MSGRTFGAAMLVLACPLALAWVLAAIDLRSDLSTLKAARVTSDDGAAMVGWAELDEPRWRTAERQRMIGYMMNFPGQPSGSMLTKTFTLLPDSGHFLHPAYRDPEETVEVRLRRPARFAFRQLVWVTGTLTRLTPGPIQAAAAWVMWDADFLAARDVDITRWFAP